MEDNINDTRAPYSLYQGDNNKWGTKDRLGEIQFEARYTRVEHEDGIDTFTDGYEVNLFSSDEGFSLLAFADPDFIEWLQQLDDDDDDEKEE